ncbi:MAG: urease accessory protein UreE [Pseudomonadota bacterium]
MLSAILGLSSQQTWHDRVHAAEQAGRLEVVRIARVDAPRRRVRLVTDKGRDVALALPRDAVLQDGAVLHDAGALMIIARIDGGPRLRLLPADASAGLRLGYFCGNLHWKADFRDGAIEIHMDGPEETYRARLRDAEKLCAFTVTRLEAEE